MPSKNWGGSATGRAALAVAINELKGGAGEVGGDNRGPFVKKYLNGILPEGNPWCVGFISHCFAQNPLGMPFEYTLGARDVLRQFKDKNWAQPPNSGYLPKPGGGVNHYLPAKGILGWFIS